MTTLLPEKRVYVPRFGTTAQIAAAISPINPASFARELAVDITKAAVVVMNAGAPGGITMLREDMANLPASVSLSGKTLQSPAITGAAISNPAIAGATLSGTTILPGGGSITTGLVSSPRFTASNNLGGTVGAFTLTGNDRAYVSYGATGQGSNGKYWALGADGNAFSLLTVNDANSATATALQVSRSGTSVTAVLLGGALAAPSAVIGPTGVHGAVTTFDVVKANPSTLGAIARFYHGPNSNRSVEIGANDLFSPNNPYLQGRASGAAVQDVEINPFGGNVSLAGPAGGESLRAVAVSSAVNRLNAYGAVTSDTYGVGMLAAGADGSIPAWIAAKGAQSVSVWTDGKPGAGGVLQFVFPHTSGANRYLSGTGSNGGAPTLGTSNGHLNLAPGGSGNTVILAGLPTSAAGLPTNALYKDGSGFIKAA